MIEKLLAYRGGNRVKRFHTVDLLVPETVGHHSANMAIILIHIYPETTLEMIRWALLHDIAEQWTGDIPAPAKWESVALKNALDELEKRKLSEYAIDLADLGTHERAVMKQADMLDLCFKMLEEVQMGNRPARVLLSRGLEFLFRNNPVPATVDLAKHLEREYHGSK